MGEVWGDGGCWGVVGRHVLCLERVVGYVAMVFISRVEICVGVVDWSDVVPKAHVQPTHHI